MSATLACAASEFNEAIAETYYWPLIHRLRKLVPKRFQDLADQSATDAMMEFLERPSRMKGESIGKYLYGAGRLALMRTMGRERDHEETFVSLDELNEDSEA